MKRFLLPQLKLNVKTMTAANWSAIVLQEYFRFNINVQHCVSLCIRSRDVPVNVFSFDKSKISVVGLSKFIFGKGTKTQIGSPKYFGIEAFGTGTCLKIEKMESFFTLIYPTSNGSFKYEFKAAIWKQLL